MAADDRTVRDVIWHAATELLAQHPVGSDGQCQRCRCAPCPGHVLARAGLDEAIGVPSSETAYWFGLAQLRLAARDPGPAADDAPDLVGVR